MANGVILKKIQREFESTYLKKATSFQFRKLRSSVKVHSSKLPSFKKWGFEETIILKELYLRDFS